MATAAAFTNRITPEEYYVRERLAEEKSDYYDGEVFAMAGGTSRHSLICANLCGELHSRLKGSPCAVYESNQRLKIQANGLRTYPDVSLYCGALIYDEDDREKDTAVNPTVVLEVLSDSTERYDRGLKAASYRTIPSLQAYILVAQHEPRVEVYAREEDATWRLTEGIGLEAHLELTRLGIRLPLAEVYARVNFDSEPAASR